jgi:hypothetical protein
VILEDRYEIFLNEGLMEDFVILECLMLMFSFGYKNNLGLFFPGSKVMEECFCEPV